MSLEKILIIKQYRDTDVVSCQKGLETSPEHYGVLIADNYQEGYRLLKEQSFVGAERLSAVIIDADEVNGNVVDLLTSLKGMDNKTELNDYRPVIVMTRLANNATRQMLSSMSTICIIKTDECDKYLWQQVKTSLLRNPSRSRTTPVMPRRTFSTFPRKSTPRPAAVNHSLESSAKKSDN